MIFKSFVAAIVFSLAWKKSIAGGTSYSNVYMQSGPGLSFYGPAALRTGQLAPIAAAPLMSSLLPPCVSPCVIPGQQVAALAPVATSNANFISYKTPDPGQQVAALAPVATSNANFISYKTPDPGQQVAALAPVATSSANFISYNTPVSVPVVVKPANDDGTSYEYSYVVYDEDTGDKKAQKETSDGSVVSGQYSLMQPDGYVREVHYTADDLRGFSAVVKNFLPEAEAKALPPCPEVKSEPLKVSNEKSAELHDLEPEPHGKAHEKIKSHERHPKPKGKVEESYAKPKVGLGLVEQRVNEKPEIHSVYGVPEGHKSREEPGELGQPESHTKNAEPQTYNERITAEQRSKKKEEEPKVTQGVAGLPGDVNALVSYNDVIKCIQSAIKSANVAQPSASPLTYIILNKPC